MKRYFFLCGILLVIGNTGPIAAQERSLFTQSKVADAPKEKRTAAAIDTDAIQEWWKDSFGDAGPKLRILEMKPRAKPADFDVKVADDWKNCADFVGPLAKEATATVAKVEGSSNGKKDVAQYLFIIRHGEVVYYQDTFRKR